MAVMPTNTTSAGPVGSSGTVPYLGANVGTVSKYRCAAMPDENQNTDRAEHPGRLAEPRNHVAEDRRAEAADHHQPDQHGKRHRPALLNVPLVRAHARTRPSESRRSGNKTRSAQMPTMNLPRLSYCALGEEAAPAQNAVHHRHHQNAQRQRAQQGAERIQRRKDAGIPVPRGGKLKIPAQNRLRPDKRGQNADDQHAFRPPQNAPLMLRAAPEPGQRAGKTASPLTLPPRGHAEWRSPAGTSDTAASSPPETPCRPPGRPTRCGPDNAPDIVPVLRRAQRINLTPGNDQQRQQQRPPQAKQRGHVQQPVQRVAPASMGDPQNGRQRHHALAEPDPEQQRDQRNVPEAGVVLLRRSTPSPR